MKLMGKVKIIVLLLVATLALSGCRAGDKQYELTNYVGSSIRTFERRTKTDLTEQSKEVYLKENTIQLIALDGKITSIALLKNAHDYMVYGVKIGMNKKEAEQKLIAIFGENISQTINSSSNTVTYTYTKDGEELYISYDIKKDTVAELSYYKMEAPKNVESNTEDVNNGELIAMVGDNRIYYNEAMVYLKSIQKKYEADYGKGIWGVDILGDGKTFGDMVKDEVIKQITEIKIIRDKAAELEISLEEDELAEAKVYARDHYKKLTETDIRQYFITEDLLERIYTDNILANKMFETLTIDVDTNVSDAEAKQITVQQILIYGTDFDSEGKKVDLTAQEKETIYEKVQGIWEKAKETEDFHALAESNTEADAIEYTFGKGQGPKEYSPIFEQAAFHLKTGEVSDIITTDYGWHILYCVSDYNEDATTQVKESIIEDRRTQMFSNLYTEWSASYDVIINSEAWKSVSLED